MDGATANLDGWRGLLAYTGLLLTAAFSIVVLFSFGGQVMVAPALLPIQWLVARHTRGFVSVLFSVLGGLLAAEVAWIALAVVIGEDVSAFLVATILAAGLAAGWVFFKISRPRPAS